VQGSATQISLGRHEASQSVSSSQWGGDGERPDDALKLKLAYASDSLPLFVVGKKSVQAKVVLVNPDPIFEQIVNDGSFPIFLKIPSSLANEEVPTILVENQNKSVSGNVDTSVVTFSQVGWKR